MALRDDFPALFTFFGSYFHQDWHDEYSSSDEVIKTYILECSIAERQQIADELDALLAGELPLDQFTESIWWNLCCQYVPTADGWVNMREWLAHVREEFANSLL